MRIGTRLIMGFGVLCAILVAISANAVIEAGRVDAVIGRLTAVRTPTAQTSAAIGKEMYASLAALRGFLLTGDAAFSQDRAKAWEAVASHSAAMDALAPNFTNPRNVRLWTEARQMLGELRMFQDQAEQAGAGDASLRILAEEAMPRVRLLETILYAEANGNRKVTDGLISDQRKMMAMDSDQAAAAAETLRLTAAIGLGLGLVAAAVVIMLTRRTIVPPIRVITGTMGNLANGDLSVAIPGCDRKDEIGEMSRALEIFRANLLRQRELEARQKADDEERNRRAAQIAELTARFDRNAARAVQAVAAAAQQLQGTAQELSSTATQTSSQATAVATASEEASVNVQTVASAAEQLSGSINEISRQVAHSSQISGMAVSEASKAGQVVAELSSAVQKIGDVIMLINDIASQTNLLALNATIEAARAGDAGKGFAVVANEVKGLANQTGKATEEIGQQISAVQEQTGRVVSTIQEIVGVIEEISQISGGIAAAVEEQSAATNEIARNVEQAAAGTAEVSGNVGGVQDAANRAGDASREVLTASRNLASEADDLRSMIEAFLSDVRSA